MKLVCMTRHVYKAKLISTFAAKMAHCGLVALLWCVAFPAWSQARFDNSIVDRGLPIPQIGGGDAIAQDHYGFIWIAGENGLGRYDGVNLRLYQAADGKPGTHPV